MSQKQGGGFRSRTRRAAARDAGPHGTGTQATPAQRGRPPRSSQAPRAGRSGQAGHAADVDMPRQVAMEVLAAVREQDAYANLVLPGLLRQRKVRGRDAHFATELTYGTLRMLGVLDAVIGAASSRELDRISPEVLDALRLGVYQILYMRVEDHAAVDTSVRLVAAAGQPKAKGFANGVLRTITRTPREEWMSRLAPSGEIAALAFRTAHPEWIARSFAQVLGTAELEAALTADSSRPVVHLAARPGEISAQELALTCGGEEGRYSPYAVYLESGSPGALEEVRQGLAAVQDEGSQLIARALVEAPVEGTDTGRWLDLCAGPGGKSALIGALARIDAAHLDAVEIAEHRATLIEQAVRGLPVTVRVADGRTFAPDGGHYDRILVDAPCSGLGALRRRPEARWRKQPSDIAQLTELQTALLTRATQLVRPGGVVVYSTCSPDLRETREVVDAVIRDTGMRECDAHGLVAPMEDVGSQLSVQMWPHRHGTDAMFFAVLTKPVEPEHVG